MRAFPWSASSDARPTASIQAHANACARSVTPGTGGHLTRGILRRCSRCNSSPSDQELSGICRYLPDRVGTRHRCRRHRLPGRRSRRSCGHSGSAPRCPSDPMSPDLTWAGRTSLASGLFTDEMDIGRGSRSTLRASQCAWAFGTNRPAAALGEEQRLATSAGPSPSRGTWAPRARVTRRSPKVG